MSVSPIAAMFDSISPKYDALNHLLSLNIDKIWRRKTAKAVAKSCPETILDLATGTADLAIALAKHNPKSRIIGMDISEKMLEIGKEKIESQQIDNQIEMRFGDAAALPFEDNTFDAVTVAFGVRNFENRGRGLAEILRVLKTDGQAFILEFSMPEKFPMKQVYRLYFNHLLPKIGKSVSKDPSAYTYLPQSVLAFPKPNEFIKILDKNGFRSIVSKQFSLGIATLYAATK